MELADQQALENQQPVQDAVIQTDNNTPAEKPSIRDALNAAVKEHAEPKDLVRDPTGKFVPKDAPEKVAASKEIPEAKTAPSVPDSIPASVPPVWKKELGDLWETLPPAVKAFAVKREENVAKGIEEYRQKTQEIEQIIAPRRVMFQQHGIQSDAQAINSLFAWEESFRKPETRAQAFVNLASSYGFDLRQFAQASQPAGEQDQNSVISTLTQRLEQAEQRLAQTGQRLDTVDSVAMQREIQTFATGKEHFEAVKPLMGQLLNGGAANSLDDAYQMALKLHPEVSALILKNEQDKAEAERKKAVEEKARAAAAAGSSVRGVSPRGDVQTKPKPNGSVSVRDSLMAAVKEARA